MPDRFKPMKPMPEDSIKEKSVEEKMMDEAKKTPSTAKRVGKKEGGEMKKKSFPDLTGDGKVTMKDILKGRGVIKKKGGMMKKADGGLIRMHKQMAMSNKKFT
jgi:hypothetical protein